MCTANRERVARAVARAHEQEWAFVLAATIRVTRDLDLAEDCVQDAYAQALAHWTLSGIPARPGAWLTTVATRRALEQGQRGATLARKLPLLVTDALASGTGDVGEDAVFPDDRLRLIFTCCHPALGTDAQLALTLRLVCGLTSAEVARAFLVREATMQARITRAKRKIAEARIPYRAPGPHELPERVDAVLDVIHLLHTAGYTAAAGDGLVRHDLAARALDLAATMRALLPDDAEVMGLLALLRLTEARRPARVRPDGQLVLMADQDRARWDQAAIAAVHAEAVDWDATDWPQIVGLYDLLIRRWPSPVVALNRAVALSFAEGLPAALAALEGVAADPALASYPYLASTRADLLRRLGRTDEAIAAYEEAIRLTGNAAEADFLSRRIAELRADAMGPMGAWP